MRFEKFKTIHWKKPPLKFELENGSKIYTNIANLTNEIFECVEEYAKENDFKGVIWIKGGVQYNMLKVEYKGDSAWLYSQSSGNFIKRLG